MQASNIRFWAEQDQPIYKFSTKGADHLSDVELLAILIQHGTAQQNAIELARSLLATAENSLKKFANYSVRDILNLKIKGIGKIKAVRILAAIELGSRRIDLIDKQVAIHHSRDVAMHLKNKLQHEQREVFMLLLLNQTNKIIHEAVLSEGGITGTVADSRIVFKLVISHGATGFIICHNHPSGQLKPSRMDDNLTEKIKKGAALFDIKLIDHLIVSSEGYYSYAEQHPNW